jgi:hypothetical protein
MSSGCMGMYDAVMMQLDASSVQQCLLFFPPILEYIESSEK